MIRILHSVSNMDRAGIETMLMNYYRNMDRSKVQFDFLCNKKKTGDYEEEICALGGRIYRTPGLNPLKYPQYLKYMRKVLQEESSCKIVEAHNGAFGFYALNAAKKNGINTRIFHAHGASIGKDWKLPLKLICKMLLPLSMNQYFTCGNAAAECYFPKRIIKQKKYHFVPNAIQIDRFCFDDNVRQRIRQENGLNGKHVIGHVGRFSYEKNHQFLLEVFCKLRERDPLACLVLIGEGDLLDTIQQKAEKLGLGDSVRLLGSLSNVNQWYQAMDVFVLPSVREGLPVVGVEAQAADLPCIFSDSVTREVCLLEKTRFVGLERGAEYWAGIIQDALKDQGRTDVSDIIASHGYDIIEQSKKLQEHYLQLAGARE